MTTTRQHIEDLDADKWATLTRRAAADSVAAAERLGLQPRAESVVLAGMSERDLVEHRQRNGPPVPRRSLAMQLVEADHLRRVAEEQAREAHQGRLDAEAAASLARDEAGEAARAATAANDRVRAVEAESARKDAESARKDAERAAERAADQKAVQEARAETERVRAGAAAEVAAAEEKVRAAEARAAERAAERTAERAAGEKTMQQLKAEIELTRAGAAAEVAAAEEKARAAEARAEQRSAERTAERATGEEAVQRVRGELEKVRSDSAAEVAAAQGQASGDVAAAREAAEAEVAAAREAAEAEVAATREAAEAAVAAAQQAAETEIAHWQAHSEDMERWARAEVSTQMLTIPIPPLGVRARIGAVESTIDALYQIDYVLEVGLAEDVESQFVPDLEFTRNLVWKVQQQAKDLTSELANLSSRYADASQVEAAGGYAQAATDAYHAFLQRIDTAIERLGSRFHSPDAEIIAAVTAMLTELRTQGLY